MSLGKRIEETRLALGYQNAAAFARKIGLDKQYLWNLEKDKVEKPDPSRMVILAKTLNVSLEWLITGEDTSPTSGTLNKQELEIIAFLKLLSKKSASELLDYAKYLCDMQSPKN
jgi:transcriptional regulator with XRE-family HTH domain